MERLTTITFARDHQHYEVKVDWNDAAVMDDLLVFEVTAKVTNRQERELEQTVVLEVDLDRGMGRILQNDQELYVFPLAEVPILITNEGDENFREGVDGGIIDPLAGFIEAINLIPVPDPILGCLLKAGISSTLAQTLACNEIVQAASTRERIREILTCLREHIRGILSRTLWRAARCMIRLGF